MEKSGEIQKFLKSLGFSRLESRVYLALLNIGPSTITKVAQRTQIPRTSVHRYIEKLIEKGFISQTYKANTRTVIAEDPKKLELIIREKEIELESRSYDVAKLRKKLPVIVSEIQNGLVGNKSNSTKVRYYEGKKGARIVYLEAFSAKKLRSYVNLSETHKVFPENNELFMQSQLKNSSDFVREIIDGSPKSIEKASLYVGRYNFQFKVSSIPQNLSSINVLLFNNKVAMVNFKGSIVISVLENKDYYENSVAIFDYLWNTL